MLSGAQTTLLNPHFENMELYITDDSDTELEDMELDYEMARLQPGLAMFVRGEDSTVTVRGGTVVGGKQALGVQAGGLAIASDLTITGFDSDGEGAGVRVWNLHAAHRSRRRASASVCASAVMG